jgi:hypothetical protein
MVCGWEGEEEELDSGNKFLLHRKREVKKVRMLSGKKGLGSLGKS